jgi:tetratricopeptide (TPR) repeat protein
MKKLILFGAAMLFLGLSTHAQESYTFTQPSHAYQEGVSLYLQKQYSAAQHQLNIFLQNANPLDIVRREEASYCMAACAFALRQSNAKTLIEEQLSTYPSSPQQAHLHYMDGILKFEAKHYNAALSEFKKITIKQLDPSEGLLCHFATGYSYMAINRLTDALIEFKSLLGNDKYDAVATYYYAYCEYALDNYDEALPYFQKIDQLEEFSALAPYYIIQIFAKQHDYANVKSYGTHLLKLQPNNSKNSEVYRLLGECNYREKNYKLAVDQFIKAGEMDAFLPRNTLYMWGISCYQTNHFADAISPLSKVATVSDSLGQNGFFWLGNSYIQLKETLKAKLAFEAASKMSYDKAIQEEAMYNYAMTTYTSTSPFGESVKIFDQFLTQFTQSQHSEVIKTDLATVLLASKDYPAALQAIQKLQSNSPQIAAAKENILFHLGVEQFNNNHYQAAIDYFTQSIAAETFGTIMAQTYFWQGECYYRLHDYQSAIKNWLAYQSNTLSVKDANYNQSNYNLGYAYFKVNDFKQSQLYFLRFAGNEHDPLLPIYNDALIRIADCHFQTRDFNDAHIYYTQVIAKNVTASAYAQYQTAFIDGLEKHYLSKIDELNKLIQNFPTSEYTEQGYYEIGRAYISLGKYDKAITAYQTLLQKFPNGLLARKSALEIGMSYYNLNNNQQALIAYKTVVANYPGSNEANEAMQNIENIYVDLADANDYLAYRRSLGKNNALSINAQDSLTFVTAEKIYFTGQTEQAINQLNQYLNQFCPQGNYCIKATYYLADCYRQLHQSTNALAFYQKLAAIKGNPYQEEALAQCASITYDAKTYDEALGFFQLLLNLTTNNTYKQAAILGILQSSYLIHNSSITITTANNIFTDLQATPEMKDEARFDRAASYQFINQPDSAFADWSTLAQDVRTGYGAQAKYEVAKYYFDKNDLVKSENEILDFINKGTPYPYWLAKSFLLLSDIYVKKGDDFQAKQYLLSLHDNYHANDEIQSLIQQQLKAIDERQNASTATTPTVNH